MCNTPCTTAAVFTRKSEGCSSVVEMRVLVSVRKTASECDDAIDLDIEQRRPTWIFVWCASVCCVCFLYSSSFFSFRRKENAVLGVGGLIPPHSGVL